jgi:hypothetical protein
MRYMGSTSPTLSTTAPKMSSTSQICFTAAISYRHHTGTRFTDVHRTGTRSLSPLPAASDPLHQHRGAWHRICFPHAHVNRTEAINSEPRPASHTPTTNADAATSST